MNTKLSDIKHLHHELDAKEQVLGRFATQAATMLVGKNKPYFTRHLDCGDFVTIINAQQIKITGKKAEQKTYTRYSGYPGGLKTTKYKQLKSDKPQEIVHHAIAGMLPDNKLKKFWLKRLIVKP